jgi:DNA-binding transcriptional MerR regulator
MISRAELVKLANALSPTNDQLSERTLRYYEYEGIIAEPVKAGREVKYDAEHLKQLIAVRRLQEMRQSLAQIRSRDVRGNTDLILSELGYNPGQIAALVPAGGAPSAHQPEKPSIKEKQMPARQATKQESDKVVEIPKAAKFACITVTGPEFELVRDSLKLGSVFAFIEGLAQPASRKLHALLYGQKTRGETKECVLYVGEDGLELPGCKLTTETTKTPVCILVSDKEAYREGQDVARIFAFNPSAKNEAIKVSVKLDGIMLDQFESKTDANGCLLVRVPTHVAGHYAVQVEEWAVDCSFEAAKYELAPFAVVLESRKKSDEGIDATLAAESFGNPFVGAARVEILEDGKGIASTQAQFNEDGKAFVVLSGIAGKNGAISLRVTSAKDALLVASVPIPGSAKADRDETVVCEMGNIVSASLLPGTSSDEVRGLFLSRAGRNNAPIVLSSCHDNAVELTFHADAKHVVVAQRGLDGRHDVEEFALVKKGAVKRVPLASSIAAVHVGCLVDGAPWEGHGTVIGTSKASIGIIVPERADPGARISIRVSAPRGASVLLKVLDKRMRVMREPMVAMASCAKAWLAAVMAGKWTGPSGVGVGMTEGWHQYFRHSRLVGRSGHRGRGLLRATDVGDDLVFGAQHLDDPWRYTVNAMPAWTNGGTMNTAWGGGGIMSTNALNMAAPIDVPVAAFYSAGHAVHRRDIEEKTSGDISLEQIQKLLASTHMPADTLILHHATQMPVLARRAEADMIYCDMLRSSRAGIAEVTMDLPDCIGAYDVRAFVVHDGDWLEASASMRVEKESYLEPLIPQVAHPEDGARARAYAVRPPPGAMFSVRVDGKPAHFDQSKAGDMVRLEWDALPGMHEVTAIWEGGGDKVARVIEAPGSETVLVQEMRILRKGEAFDVAGDVLSVAVLPGIESETDRAIMVCSEFSHSCCEQTSAKIVAACLAIALGGNDDRSSKARESIIRGEARLRLMYVAGKGFQSYPDGSIYPDWSRATAKRLALAPDMVASSAGMTDDVRRALKSLSDMANNVLAVHGKGDQGLPMESAYYGRRAVAASEARAATEKLGQGVLRDCAAMSEACFAAACLVRDNDLAAGIPAANAVCKAIGRTMSGAMHGTCEILAYLHMILELQRRDVVRGAKGTSVTVDGKKLPIEKAVIEEVSSRVLAHAAPVAIRIQRLQSINLDEYKTDVPMTVSLLGKNGEPKITTGNLARLRVKVQGCKNGDVLCLYLPQCMSYMIGGAKAKKVQLDFAGKDEIEVDLVVHETTSRPQKWGTLVRNMYDGNRIGSPGMLSVEVAE